jgi:hypothetical protein
LYTPALVSRQGVAAWGRLALDRVPVGPSAQCDDRRARSDPQGFHRVNDYHACIVFAVGMAAIGACLALHSFFMFLVLEAQMVFRLRYPRARGAWLVIPSMLMAGTLLVVSCFLQIGLWAIVLGAYGRFELMSDMLYFSGTTFTTLGTGKHGLVAPYCVLEPMEATNGILVAGLNAALLYAILANIARQRNKYDIFG